MKDGIVKIEVFITTRYKGKTERTCTLRGLPLKGHFNISMSRAHTTKIKNGKTVFLPSKEISLLLYTKVGQQQKARKNLFKEG